MVWNVEWARKKARTILKLLSVLRRSHIKELMMIMMMTTVTRHTERRNENNFVGIRSKIFNLNTFCAYDLCGFLATHVLYSLLFVFFFNIASELYVDREQRSQRRRGRSFAPIYFIKLWSLRDLLFAKKISFKEKIPNGMRLLFLARLRTTNNNNM